MAKHLPRERSIDESQNLLILGNPHTVSCIIAHWLNDSTIKVTKGLRTTDNWDNLSLPWNEVFTSFSEIG
jgi:hypothetical protein